MKNKFGITYQLEKLIYKFAFVIFHSYLITERFLAIYIKPLVHQHQTAYEFDYTRALSNKYLSKQKLHRSLNTRLITIIKKIALLPQLGLRVFNNHHVRFLCKLSPPKSPFTLQREEEKKLQWNIFGFWWWCSILNFFRTVCFSYYYFFLYFFSSSSLEIMKEKKNSV